MKLFSKIKEWFKNRKNEREIEMIKSISEHMIPIEVGDVISCNGSIVYKNGVPYNGNGYKDGKKI